MKKKISGLFWPKFDEEIIAAEIQEQENQGRQLASSFGASLSTRGFSETLVLIYRKK